MLLYGRPGVPMINLELSTASRSRVSAGACLAIGAAVAVWLLCAGAGARLGAQTPVLRTGVTLVPLDVRVVDRDGKPVVGLTRDDFVVTEDGVRQPITFFEERSLRGTPASTGPKVLLPGVTEPTGIPGQKRRVFLLALERPWLPNVPFTGVEALTRFLRERLTPNDYAAVAAFGRITDLTNDHEALAEVVERLLALQTSIEKRSAQDTEGRALFMLASTPNIPGAEAISRGLDAVFAPASAGIHAVPRHNGEFENVVYRVVHELWAKINRDTPVGKGRPSLNAFLKAAERRTGNVIGALQYLRFIEGEKHLIYPFVGPGFLSFDSDQNIARIAADAQVSIDFIKADGLEAYSGQSGLTPYASFERMYGEMSFKNVASISGGQVFLDRNPDLAYASIDDTTRASYLVAYSPANPALDGRYRKIKVEVKGPKGATVINRQSYRASEKRDTFDAEQFAARDRILTAADWPGGLDDLGVKLSAEMSGRGVAATVRVDFRQVQSTPQDGRHVAKLEVAVFVTDKSERPIGSRFETLNLALKDETLTRMLADGFVHSVIVPVSNIARLVKVVVYDYATGRAGSALVRIN